MNRFNTYHRRFMTPLARFRQSVDIVLDRTSCWKWNQRLDARTGYGIFFLGDKGRSKSEFAHRATAKLILSIDLTRSDQVCHHCDNRPCVRPSHLKVADAKWNAMDRNAKGRHNMPTGERVPQAKLSNADIAEIYRLRNEGWTQKRIAEHYGVSRQAIGNIFLGRSWNQQRMVLSKEVNVCHTPVKFWSRSHRECYNKSTKSQKRNTARGRISYAKECADTSTISAEIRSLLIAGLFLYTSSSSQPAICQSTTDETKIRYIEGLIEVKKKPKRFVYKCKNTTETVTLTEKVKDVPDLRPYEVAHPVKHAAKQRVIKVRNWCEFTAPLISLAGWLATVAIEAAKRCG